MTPRLFLLPAALLLSLGCTPPTDSAVAQRARREPRANAAVGTAVADAAVGTAVADAGATAPAGEARSAAPAAAASSSPSRADDLLRPLASIRWPEVARPPAGARCPRVTDEGPVSLGDGLLGRCVRMRGWWGTGVLLIAESRDGSAGFRVLRPFSFVREKNPSLGWPSWYALDAFLVDTGWREGAEPSAIDAYPNQPEAMFRDQVEVRGVLRRAPAEQLWSYFEPLLRRDGMAPYGAKMLELVLHQAPASAGP